MDGRPALNKSSHHIRRSASAEESGVEGLDMLVEPEVAFRNRLPLSSLLRNLK